MHSATCSSMPWLCCASPACSPRAQNRATKARKRENAVARRCIGAFYTVRASGCHRCRSVTGRRLGNPLDQHFQGYRQVKSLGLIESGDDYLQTTPIPARYNLLARFGCATDSSSVIVISKISSPKMASQKVTDFIRRKGQGNRDRTYAEAGLGRLASRDALSGRVLSVSAA